MVGHRGITHSLLAIIVWGLLLRWAGFSRPVVDAIVVGYLSHLVADLLTSSGLRLMWPSRLRFAIPLCKTGSMTEWIIVACAVAWVGAHTMGWALIPRL
jgi:inner membrane protein